MTPQEIFQYLVLILSPVLSFVGVLLGLRANKRIKEAIGDKREAEAKQISANATDKLVDTALELNEPLRLALKNEREVYSAALAEERKARKEEAAAAQAQIAALQLIVNQNSKDLHELRADYEWLYDGATVLTHQLKSQKIEPLFNLNERRKT